MRRLFFILMLPFFTNSYSQQWVELNGNDRQYSEIDISSIKRNGEKVAAWIRTGYKTNNAKNYYINKKIESFEKEGVKTSKNKWRDWSFTMIYEEFDCAKNTIKIITTADYNEDGSVIFRVDYAKGEEPHGNIVPNSTAYEIFVNLCEEYVFEINGKRYSMFIEEAYDFMKKHPEAKFLE